MSNQRRIALKILLKIDKDGAYSNLSLKETLGEYKLERTESAFISALVYGVCEHRITLDYYIKKLSSTPFSKISLTVRNILRIGLYQIVYMDKVPESAAVNESVNLIKGTKEYRLSGFVNAILRSAIRKLPDLPNGNTPEDLSVRYSCSEQLINLLLESFTIDDVINILSYSLIESKVYIRVNTLKINGDDLISLFKKQGISAQKTEIAHSLALSKVGNIEENDLYKQGLFHVQDLSSQKCAQLVEAYENCSFLDVCSAPGGKCFTVCENMNDKGFVLAYDIYPHRVGLIENGAQRLGISSIKTSVLDTTTENSELFSKFDRVLCDVPCSGSGVIGRKPDIKYKDFSDLKELNNTQFAILKNSFNYLKKGGKLVYSTCSILDCENMGVVKRLLESTDAKLEYSHLFLPHIDKTDGFFTAVISK